ncbi:hypothetical protein K2Z83_27630 [Oscillochloris sp. ZM17-4]|uniref:hypothetical protein n=1 Tax=Oscillochloris sp. ZM17-4 TaxID=2866714 RepID=UPI001C72C21F|nr:hypothetical protein [Oscillochloris sp. ZM17-4]MBX0331428.1 hypothetical protein [Oscillochloris sp. ZM17-4]
MNLLTARISITGVRPLLWHAFGPDAIPLEKRERSGVAGNDPEEWKRTLLITPDQQLYLPGSYAFACLRDGARFSKKGRGSLQPAVASTLQILDDRMILPHLQLPNPISTDPSAPIYLDIRSVRNPGTKARNIRYRIAAATGWTLTFHIQWDKTVVARGEMESVIIDAGRLVGIGNGRSIGFGRFAMTAFAITDDLP